MARQAHDDAVREALGYLERHATWTRRCKNGKHLVRGEGLTVAAFRHRTSRAGDPQLHTHAVVANTTTAEGRETALDGRALYAHQRTAGFLYQAALRHNLTHNLGVEWEPVHNGVAEISGIDDEVLNHFSRRSQEIRERLAQVGGRSAHAAEIAALETRKVKDYNVPAGRLREEWRARAAELGLDHHVLSLVLEPRAPSRPAQPDLAATAEEIAAPALGVVRDAVGREIRVLGHATHAAGAISIPPLSPSARRSPTPPAAAGSTRPRRRPATAACCHRAQRGLAPAGF